MTARLDLTASRNIAWAPTIDLFYQGGDLPLNGATIRMQIRLYPGAPGEPIATLDGIPFIDLPPLEGDPRRRLRLAPAMLLDTVAAFPTGLNRPEPGEADSFSYDIVVTYADDLQDKLAIGSFILEPGVTRV